MGYAFDGPNKRIDLTSGTVEVSVRDIWSRWVDWMLTGDNSKYLPAFDTVGGNDIDLTSGTSIPIYAFLKNGWRIRPQEASHTLRVFDGILLVDGGGDPFLNTVGAYTVRINFQQPVQAITVTTGGAGGTDWTSTERNQIRQRLGIDGASAVPAATPSLGTLDRQNEILTKLDTLSITSGSLNASATGFTLTTGTVTAGSYADVRSPNGVVHTIIDSAGTLDMQYEFMLLRDSLPADVKITADLSGNNDSLVVYAWNWTLSSWEQVGIRQGDNNNNLTTNTYPLLLAHVGSGVDSGRVLIRFANTGLTSAQFRVDYATVTFATVSKRTGFVGSVAAATTTTFTLGSEASAVNDFYRPGLAVITSGLGRDQSRRIESYDGATRTATVATAWSVTPDTTSVVEIYPWASVRVSDVDADTNFLTATQVAQLRDLHRIHGLETGTSLFVTSGSRLAGDITQNIVDVAGTVTVSRA